MTKQESVKTGLFWKLLPVLAFALLAFALCAKPAHAESTQGFYTYYDDYDHKGGVIIKKYTGDEINCKIPKKLGKKPVTAIGWGAFDDKEYMKTVSIPATVKMIDGYSFRRCKSLTAVTIPNSVESIGSMIFEECPNLKTVKLSAKITVIPEKAFNNCPKLTKVTMSNKVTKINGMAFNGCASLKDFNLPASLEEISYQAFNGCNSLTKIIIPDTVTKITSLDWVSEATLGNCANLKTVVFGKKITNIPSGVCRANPKLTSVTFKSAKAEEVGDHAFDGCTSLKSITLPAYTGKLGTRAFKDCTSLTTIKLNEGLSEIGSWCFEGCTSLKTITIPSTVNIFEYEMFRSNQLQTVIFKPCFDRYKYSENLFGYDFPNLTVSFYSYSQFRDRIINKAGDNYKYKILKAIPAKSVKLSKKQVVLYEGQDTIVKPTVTPANNTSSLHWESSNENIAKVMANGWIKATGHGSAVITAVTDNGKAAQVNVICQKAPDNIEFPKTAATLAVGQGLKNTALVDQGSRTDVKPAYKSSNTAVATVNAKGVIKAKKAGTAVITASTYNGLVATCKITVKKAPAKITLSKKSLKIKKGKTKRLTYKIPAGSYTSKVTFTSSNKKVATVNQQGYVTAKKKGKCKITVKTHNGKKAVCKIKVKK